MGVRLASVETIFGALTAAATVTPHAEAFQGVLWHLMVSHPALKAAETKWESAARPAA